MNDKASPPTLREMFDPHIFPSLHYVVLPREAYWEEFDNEERYDLNGGHPRYSKTDIVYSNNSLGYRSPEFDIDREGKFVIAIVGCSNSKGVGLPLHETYGELLKKNVEQIVGKPVIVFNLSHGGSSNEKIAIRSLRAVDHLKPDFLITQWTYTSRLLFVQKDGVLVDWWSLTEEEMKDPTRNHLKIKYIQDVQTDWNDMHRYLNLTRTMGMILNKKQSGYLQHMMFRYTESSPMDGMFDHRYTIGDFIPHDGIKARDRVHRGWTTHAIIAEKLTERFQKWWDTKATA